jgi:hypothetical protein
LQPYFYKALGTDGHRSEGTLVAADRREALERLLSQGWHVLELGEKQAKRGVPLAERFSLRRGIRLATLTRQLATLCSSGVPLVQSISVLIEQSENPRARDVLSDILESIKSGRSLSDALAEHRGLFPEMMISMVRMGEVSGTLDEVLDRLAELFERQEELRGEVRAALASPALVLLLGLASAAVLVTFVMPRLTVIFVDLGERLPSPGLLPPEDADRRGLQGLEATTRTEASSGELWERMARLVAGLVLATLVLALLGLFGLPQGFRRAVLGRGKGSWLWLALQLLEQKGPPELAHALRVAAHLGGLR